MSSNIKFSVVISRPSKGEIRRSVGWAFEKALEKSNRFNKCNQDKTWNAEIAYVEETSTVKHLPIDESL